MILYRSLCSISHSDLSMLRDHFPPKFNTSWPSLKILVRSAQSKLTRKKVKMINYTEKMQRCQEYIEALEEERRKMQVFQRELPLCLDLVTQDDDEQQSHEPKDNEDCKNNDKSSKKSDWFRSVQLWNQTPDPPTKEDSPRKVSVMEVNRKGNSGGGGAFHPFKRERSVGTVPGTAAASSTVGTGGSSGGKQEEIEGQSERKARRCWSPELHRRFLQALQQLGGPHVATPKQIREVMKVDGLSNDEVKSHLQKYRLHTRRPSASIHNNNHPQAPQFVVVGGIWVPPPQDNATKTACGGGVATSNGIYAPTPTLLPPLKKTSGSLKRRQQHKQLHSDERGSHSEGRVHSNSPTTSSSTHTTTASPSC